MFHADYSGLKSASTSSPAVTPFPLPICKTRCLLNHSLVQPRAGHLAENDCRVGGKMDSGPDEQVCLSGNGLRSPRGGLAYLPCTRIQGEEEAFSIRRCLTVPSFGTSWPWNKVSKYLIEMWCYLHTLKYYLGSDSG